MPQDSDPFRIGVKVTYRGIKQGGDKYKDLIGKEGVIWGVGGQHESLTVKYKEDPHEILVMRPANDDYWTRHQVN